VTLILHAQIVVGVLGGALVVAHTAAPPDSVAAAITAAATLTFVAFISVPFARWVCPLPCRNRRGPCLRVRHDEHRCQRCGRHAETFGELVAAQACGLQVECQLVGRRQPGSTLLRFHRSNIETAGAEDPRSGYAFSRGPSTRSRSPRLRTPSLAVARRMWPSTVLTLTPSCAAISLLDRPSAARRLISRSRRVRS
jgi:hypothetical protein